MNVHDLLNFGKGLAESYVEKGLELARVAETQARKAVETYNFLTELLPFPLPKLGGDDPYEPYEPPPAPSFSSKPSTAKPKKSEGATVKVVTPKPEATKPEPKAAKPKAAKPEAAKPEAKATKAEPKRYSRNALRQMRKADLQRVCRENAITYQHADTNNTLIQLILEKLGK